MPPPIQRVPLPTTRGRDAHDYLAAHGITAVIPSIRSSDGSAACEFQYYLGRRLGLRPLHSYNPALHTGSWAHRYLQLWYAEDRDAMYDGLIRDAVSAVPDFARAVMAPPGWADTHVTDLKHDAEYARALLQNAFNLPIGTGTIRTRVLENPRYRPLAHELTLSCPAFPPESPRKSRTDLRAQIDLLLYDHSTRSLSIVDLKTTSAPPLVRAEPCPVEFQTWLYLHVTRRCLPEIIRTHGLPPDTTLRQMIHLIVQKPGIRLSGEDRDHRFVPHVLTRGPRRGQTEMRKEYLSDEPRWSNFLQRMNRYMRGTGEYEQHAAARADTPMANIHYTPLDAIPDSDWEEFHGTIAYLHDLATRDPYPGNFRRVAKCMLDRASLTPYALLYRKPVQEWPQVIRASNLIVDRREPDPDLSL